MLDVEKLAEMNHWWKMGKVKEEFALPYKRKLFKDILKHLKLRQIIGIVGLRRVGKSTLFYQLIDHLIKNKINPENILYFSFDESRAELSQVFKIYEEDIIKKKIGNEKIFVFLDEVQKLDDWQNKIKIYYDLHPNIKFFVSGSASLSILLRGKESLAGRIFYFHLDLLSFEEFLELRKKKAKRMKEKPDLWKRELRIELKSYLLKAFPEIVNATDEIAKKYIKESIIEKVILKDVRDLFEIREIEVLEKIINVIASNPGIIISLDDMSKDFGISRQVLSNYLYYMQCCFLVKQLKNFRGSLRVASRKLKKYYLFHPALALALAHPERGRIAENMVSFKSEANYYWREGEKEVDFVLNGKKAIPIEVKYKKNVRERELKPLLKFMERFKVKSVLVLTDDFESQKKLKGKTIKFIPLWKWLLE